MSPRILSGARLAAVLLLATVLGGCAFGRTYSYTDAPVAMQGITSSGTVAVVVQDSRPYVVSGAKPAQFVGLMRGGFGNPFDVNTQSGGSLATEMRGAVERALSQKGISVTTAGARRSVLVTLTEWKSDTMINTTLHYNVSLGVTDEKGVSLATTQIKGIDNLGGLGLDPGPGVSRMFVQKFDQLFADEKIVTALR